MAPNERHDSPHLITPLSRALKELVMSGAVVCAVKPHVDAW
jgi:hypothetical protein